MKQEIINEIEKYPIITVFRHQHPDADALGSQFGLVSWLKRRYPEKRIIAMGAHRGSSPHLFGIYEAISDEDVQRSLAIINDVANADRIDDERFKIASKRIKIDHHPFVEVYADIEWIDEKAASTSELITELINHFQKDALDEDTANYLYLGILADTLRFSTRNTRPQTLEMAAFLLKSHINLGQLNDELFALSKEELDFTTFIREKAIYDHNLVYIIIKQADLEAFKIKQAIAKEKIYELGLVRETEIWAMFIEQSESEGGLYNGSLRSRHKTVNDIARMFKGGGHVLAAAVKGLKFEEIETVLDLLRKRIKETA